MATKSETSTSKRKRLVLSIDDKVEVLKLIGKDVSYSIIMDKYGIGRSTVSDIKKKRASINGLQKVKTIKTIKTMKIGNDVKLDQAVFLWFRQKRAEVVPVSGSILCEKAVELSRRMQARWEQFQS